MRGWVYVSSVRVHGRLVVITDHLREKLGVSREDHEGLEEIAREAAAIIRNPDELFREARFINRYVAVVERNGRYKLVVYEVNSKLVVVTMIEDISEKRYMRMRNYRVKNKRWIPT